jgi:hypothetical protein
MNDKMTLRKAETVPGAKVVTGAWGGENRRIPKA